MPATIDTKRKAADGFSKAVAKNPPTNGPMTKPKSFDVSNKPDISPYKLAGIISVSNASVPGNIHDTAPAASNAKITNIAGFVDKNIKPADENNNKKPAVIIYLFPILSI